MKRFTRSCYFSKYHKITSKDFDSKPNVHSVGQEQEKNPNYKELLPFYLTYESWELCQSFYHRIDPNETTLNVNKLKSPKIESFHFTFRLNWVLICEWECAISDSIQTMSIFQLFWSLHFNVFKDLFNGFNFTMFWSNDRHSFGLCSLWTSMDETIYVQMCFFNEKS